jgi:hypothetical protein
MVRLLLFADPKARGHGSTLVDRPSAGYRRRPNRGLGDFRFTDFGCAEAT